MKMVEGAEDRVKSSFGSRSPGSDGTMQGTECGIPEDEPDIDFNRSKPISAIAGGRTDNKWNQLAPGGGDSKSGGFGPVIFRVSTQQSFIDRPLIILNLYLHRHSPGAG